MDVPKPPVYEVPPAPKPPVYDIPVPPAPPKPPVVEVPKPPVYEPPVIDIPVPQKPPVYEVPPAPPVFDPSQPYSLEKGASGVPFHPSNPDSLPKEMIYQGNTYKLVGSSKTQVHYQNNSLKLGSRNVRINYSSDKSTNGDKPYELPNYPVRSINMASPLVLDLDGDGIKTTEQNRTFDLEGDGTAYQISSLGKDDAKLVFDPNNNGVYGESGLELFGNNTDIHGTGKPGDFANGFEALRAYAALHLGEEAVADNVLDASELKALEQNHGLRLNVNGEIKTLSEKGVTEIRLNYDESDKVDEFGNEFRQTTSFVRNGEEREIVDIWFQGA